MRKALGILLALSAASCTRTPPQDPALADLQGAWNVIQITTNGQQAPSKEIEGMKFIFRGDKLTMSGPGEGPDEVTVKIDSKQSPAAMDMIDGEALMRGIYKLERDTLTVATTARRSPPLPRPTQFEAGPGSENSVMVFKRP